MASSARPRLRTGGNPFQRVGIVSIARSPRQRARTPPATRRRTRPFAKSPRPGRRKSFPARAPGGGRMGIVSSARSPRPDGRESFPARGPAGGREGIVSSASSHDQRTGARLEPFPEGGRAARAKPERERTRSVARCPSPSRGRPSHPLGEGTSRWNAGPRDGTQALAMERRPSRWNAGPRDGKPALQAGIGCSRRNSGAVAGNRAPAQETGPCASTADPGSAGGTRPRPPATRCRWSGPCPGGRGARRGRRGRPATPRRAGTRRRG